MTRHLSVLALICFALLGSAGCSGSSESGTVIPYDLYGTWKLTRIRGGVGGVDMAPSYTETVQFRVDQIATIQRDASSPISGKFTAVRKVTDLQSQPLLVLGLPGGTLTEGAILEKSATHLTLSQINVSDRLICDYTRQVSP